MKVRVTKVKEVRKVGTFADVVCMTGEVGQVRAAQGVRVNGVAELRMTGIWQDRGRLFAQVTAFPCEG